jgi:hypothetical protein
MHGESFLWVMAGVLALPVLAALLFKLSPNARIKRRLKKARGRIISKARQPSVRLSVKRPRE